jgi:hypothetical protein
VFMTPMEQSEMRHALRGCMNALKLGVSVLDTDMTADESLEFITYLEQSAAKMETLLDQWETKLAASA